MNCTGPLCATLVLLLNPPPPSSPVPPPYPRVPPLPLPAMPADRIVPTDATHLSPELSKGDRAEYLGQDGQSVGATIEQVDASHW